MNYHNITKDDMLNGDGLRVVLWVSGCDHHCKECQNPQTWDPNGGALVPVSEVLKVIDELECQTGITFSGGDPMYQPEACNEIAKYCKSKGYHIWTYTGFTFEELMKMAEKKPIYKEFLSNTDILVDGEFRIQELDLNLLFRGSRNQRLIDVQKTLETGKIVLFDEEAYNDEKSFERTPTFV